MISQRSNAVAPLRVDIAVCTFRRPQLAETLRSLGRLAVPEGTTLRIIIADNDVTPSAEPLVERLRGEIPFALHYVHCPAGNISIARNACLDSADADFLAFLDDDEVASELWLVNLLNAAEATGAEVVLGPVKAVYLSSAPEWMRNGDFHSTMPVWVRGEIRTGYTCNTLLRPDAPSLRGRRFNLALGRTGGEDTEFFTHMHEAGGRIAFAEEAWLDDPVPENRASFGWLAKRRFRVGQTHGRLLAEGASALKRPASVALAAAKATVCFVSGAVFALSPITRNRFLLRGVMHTGVVAGLLGAREIRQYGALEAASS
ncbi:glycosyltransferase family 2 protein [Sinorhizobium sp. BG8]|uniref:glycosyltransferase n=1 Tax=Sinorhizobium sp. BG8 TaxID=2613773 RepID=UPI00193CCD92|nr:glycosyltransferase family 2 protein [Sinorhizobium sp. BG8]QRM57344.1 glycosyltransferase family 2 protein [Sinorhizobium sp. BG8]